MARRGGWTYRVHQCWCGRAGFPTRNGVRCVDHATLDDAVSSLVASPTPVNEVQHDLERMAFTILDEAEYTIGVKSLARERASSGEWPAPKNIGQFLFWIEDEASLQADMAEVEVDFPDGNETRLQTHAQALQDVADRLRDLGFTPAPAPWLVNEVSSAACVDEALALVRDASEKLRQEYGE